MSDRTTCFGCNELVWAIMKDRSVFFYCKHHKQIVGKRRLNEQNRQLDKPKPPKDKNCKHFSESKKKSITSNILEWVKRLFTRKQEV